MSLTLRTNAKINLFLRVLGKRPDGYHEIESIFHSVGLGDDITIEPSSSGAVEVTMSLAPGVAGTIPKAADNLAAIAAGVLSRKEGSAKGAKIHITKRIPIAAGLGGGSGNAAGVLVSLNQIWGLGLERSILVELASEVGSDVGFCIEGGTTLALGRGERLTHLAAPATMWFVLGISNQPLLTKDVYGAWERTGASAGRRTSRTETGAPMTLALGAGDVPGVAMLLHNELEPAAFALRPDLEKQKAIMTEAGALGACLSGSGPTIFGVCEDEAAAAAVASRVQDAFDRTEVVASRPQCVELPSGS